MGKTVSLFTLTIIASVVLFIAVGNFAGRRVKNLDDYLVAGRRAPTLLIVGTLVASLMSTTVFMGKRDSPTPDSWTPSAAVWTHGHRLRLRGPVFRHPPAAQSGHHGGGFLRERFDDDGVQRLAGLTIIPGLGGYLLVVILRAALLIAELTLELRPCIFVALLGYSAFTLGRLPGQSSPTP